jgi:sRNA-binding protein
MSGDGGSFGATIVELVAAFPAAFTLDPSQVKPLKLGIREDICNRSDLSRRLITAALAQYCNASAYLQVCTEGAARIALDGTADGVVTEPEARHVECRLAGMTRGIAKDVRTAPERGAALGLKDVSKEKPVSQLSTPSPQRLSLADLKRAAATRRAHG